MANEVTIIVKAKNDTKAIFADAKKDAASLGQTMGETITKNITERITAGSKSASTDFSRAGDGIGDSLGRRIRERITEHVKVAFGRGGKQKIDVDVDVDQDSRKTFGERVRDLATTAGDRIRETVSNGLAMAFSGDTITLILKGLLAALVATVAAPAIGAALVAGILLALGGGALAAGVVSAFKDPQIQGAAADLKDRLGKMFEEFGKPFRGPVADFLEKFNRFLEQAQPQVQAIADALAPVAGELGTAFIGMLQNALPGITDAVIAAVPLLEMLADHMPGIGQAVGDFMRNIADGAPGAAQFFGDLLTVIEKLLPVIGAIAGAFSRSYTRIRSVILGAIALVRSLANGARGAANTIRTAMTGAANRFSTAFNTARARVSAVFNGIVASVRGAVNAIGAQIRRAQAFVNSFSLGNIGSAVGNLLGFAHGGVVGAATGGIHGGMRLVGEAGPELVNLPPGSRVHSTGDSARMMGGGGGGGELTVRAARDAEGTLTAAIMKILRYEVRTQGGNVQQVLGVAGR
jgi:phage-related protein